MQRLHLRLSSCRVIKRSTTNSAGILWIIVHFSIHLGIVLRWYFYKSISDGIRTLNVKIQKDALIYCIIRNKVFIFKSLEFHQKVFSINYRVCYHFDKTEMNNVTLIFIPLSSFYYIIWSNTKLSNGLFFPAILCAQTLNFVMSIRSVSNQFLVCFFLFIFFSL